MFPALETVINAEKSFTFGNVLGTIEVSDVWNFFIFRLIKENLWKSGMTFLEPWSGFEWIAFSIMLTGIVGWILVICRRPLRTTAMQPIVLRYILLCLMAVGATFAGAYAHGLNCRLAWGALITPAYYVMVAFPALWSLSFYGLAAFGSVKLTATLLIVLGVNYLLTEIDSLVRIAIPYWTHSTEPTVIMHRLTILSSAWTDPRAVLMWWVLALAGLIVATCATRQTFRTGV
jgi:hypothetical protein